MLYTIYYFTFTDISHMDKRTFIQTWQITKTCWIKWILIISHKIIHVSKVQEKKYQVFFSDETNWKLIDKFVFLRAKLYCYKVEGNEFIKAKVMKGHVVKYHMTFNDHKFCLFENVSQNKKKYCIQTFISQKEKKSWR